MREFKLINAMNDEYPLNTIEKGYIVNPSGLGYGYITDVQNIGDNIIPTSSRINRSVVSGSIIFPNYSTYDEFITFVSIGGLKLGYKPTDADSWRYIKVDIVISKTEIDRYNKLSCSVTFNGLSRWMGDTVTYTGTASVTVADFPKGSPFRITITGATNAPTWSFTQNGTVVAKGKTNRNVLANKVLVVDATPDTFGITYDGVSDFENADITTTRYFVSNGKGGTISVSPTPTSLKVEVIPYV